MSQPFIPRDFQLEIIEHQLELERGATFAGMGTGKTSSTLTALDAIQLGKDGRPGIVFAPLRVAQSTWPAEAAKWDHLSGMQVTPIVGNAETRHRLLFGELKKGNTGLFTTNYENAAWLVETLAAAGAGWPFGSVIADESTKLKGFRLRQGTKRARALGRIAHAKASRWVNLTGTPAPNGLKDLWGQTWFLDAGQRLGRTYDSFSQRWFRTGFNGYGMDPMPHAQAEIERLLSDICLTIMNGLGVDEPVVNTIYVDLPSRARRLYDDMERDMYADIAGTGVEAFSAGSKTMKCRQLASGAIYTDDEGTWQEVHDEKLQALEDVIEEAAGMPVLVAYYFKSDLARLRKAFPKARHLDADPKTIDDWNAGRIPVMLAHPASAGHGLNLQDGSNILVFFSVDWDLELHDQIIERIGPARQKQSGHDRPVFIHYILASDTVEDVVMERLTTKREVQDLLLEAMQRKGLA